MPAKKMICVVCPKGCEMEATPGQNQTAAVTGNNCKRGEEYAVSELFNAKRMLTTTLRVDARPGPVSVRTAQAIPKNLLLPAMDVIRRAKTAPPIQVGDVLIPNLLNTGIDLIATSEMK